MIYPQTLGLGAGELFPVAQVKSKLLVVIIHVLYSVLAFTVTFGNVATYSIIPPFVAGLVVAGVNVVLGLGELRYCSVSRNFTLDASPLFTVTIATISPFDLSTSNIVRITLNMSSPVPVSA